MEREPTVVLRRVSKSYSRVLRKAQRNGVAAILGEVFGRPHAELRGDEFWAVRDIDLEVAPGTSLGLLGRNGAGKSTLLRLVAGITRPTSGEVETQGKLASLLDFTAGFSPVLSGRENVEAAFTLLSGEPPTATQIEEILDYAGLAAASAHPVRAYSQGMRMRLGFSVLIHTDPDILVIDEAIAVGDTAFQLQCIDFLHSYRRAGGTLVFATQSLWLFQNLATHGIHIDGGRVVCAGDTETVADHYMSALQGGSWVDTGPGLDLVDRERVIRSAASVEAEASDHEQADPIEPDDADAGSGQGQEEAVLNQRPVSFARVVLDAPGGSIRTGSPIDLTFHIESNEAFEGELGFMFWTSDLSICLAADLSHTIDGVDGRRTFEVPIGRSSVRCRLDTMTLTAGHYAVRAAVYDGPTGDIMGMVGFEDTPVWFEVAADPAVHAHHPPTDEIRLRPLVAVEIGQVSVEALGEVVGSE